MVHWDSERFKDFNAAANGDRGLAVLGVFLEVGDSAHPEIQKIVDALVTIPNKGLTSDLPSKIDPAKLLPPSTCPNKFFSNFKKT